MPKYEFPILNKKKKKKLLPNFIALRRFLKFLKYFQFRFND